MLALWVITAPFGVMAMVSGSDGLKQALARFQLAVVTLGWIALATIVANVMLLGESRSELALWIAAPVAGLAVWVGGRGDDDGGEEPPPEPEPDGGPGEAARCTGRTRPPVPSARARGAHPQRRRVRTRVR
jgi:hypothetical protein